MNEKKKILIVEDTRIIALSIKNDLEELNYEIAGIVDNGAEAIEKAQKLQPDLILMDINIKGSIDGIETSRQILSVMNVPIIYLTAYTDKSTVNRAINTSPYGYIIKPYEEKTLEITLNYAFYKHEHERTFRNIFNATHDGLTITDLEGQIVDSNISTLSIFDLKEAIVDFKTILNKYVNFIDTDTYFENAVKHGIAVLEFDVINNDLIETIEVKAQTIIHNGTTALLHIIRNISLKKNLQKNIIKTILQTEERDKSKFAEELHDGIGPLLSTIKTYLNTLEDEVDETDRKTIIKKLFEINDEVIQTVKEISNDLRPHLLRNFGFVSAANTFLLRIKEAHKEVDIQFDTELKTRFSESVEVALFRIVCELTNNSLKHSKATKILISLHKENKSFQFKYSDNGVGFDIRKTMQEEKGMGLQNILNRVNSLPATAEMTSVLGYGFTCVIAINEAVFQPK
ncbi:MAG: response regulator [Bacteroidales bacterium]|nr:response regulator [Bacteroidales bacterium]